MFHFTEVLVSIGFVFVFVFGTTFFPGDGGIKLFQLPRCVPLVCAGLGRDSRATLIISIIVIIIISSIIIIIIISSSSSYDGVRARARVCVCVCVCVCICWLYVCGCLFIICLLCFGLGITFFSVNEEIFLLRSNDNLMGRADVADDSRTAWCSSSSSSSSSSYYAVRACARVCVYVCVCVCVCVNLLVYMPMFACFGLSLCYVLSIVFRF